jgi:hypothetical protein
MGLHINHSKRLPEKPGNEAFFGRPADEGLPAAISRRTPSGLSAPIRDHLLVALKPAATNSFISTEDSRKANPTVIT